MRNRHLLIVFAIVLAVGLSSWLTARGQDAGRRARPTAVAVVAVQRVFNTCKEKADIDASFRSALEQAEADRETRAKQIQQLQYDLELIAPDANAYSEKRSEIERSLVELQVESTFRKNQVVREQMLRYDALYHKLKEVCAEAARESGYDLVLFRESDELKYKTPQELVNQIGGRKVLYASEDLDITDQVIQKLNNVWDSRAR